MIIYGGFGFVLALHHITMAAAGWNQETKARLSEKVAVNMNDLASLTKHVLRGSKSSDVSMEYVCFSVICTLRILNFSAMLFYAGTANAGTVALTLMLSMAVLTPNVP